MKNKKRWLLGALACAIGFTVQAQEIGARAKGGFAESFFMEKVPKAEAQATAQRLAKAVIAARMIIFTYAGKLVDPNLGDKGFSGDVFERQWRDAIEPDMIDATPTQKRLYEKLIWAGRQVIENNQDRINTQGVGWKNFLPAKWEREMGQVFTARTGIVIKQPGRAYRSPMNAPDNAERAALVHFVKAARDNNRPLTSTEQWGKQTVYRHMEPIRLLSPCLPCHGKPKGELDIVNFEKDGLEAGDVIGLMSVSFGVTD
jgi:hypothetical protein